MRLEQISGLVRTFPGMPGAALKLLGVLDDPGVTVQQIERILRQDPGLTANVLKLANSAYFGIPSKVGSVRQAVMLLGLKRLIQMVIAACTGAVLDRTVPGYDLPAGELWRHSLAVSVAAERLVRELRIPAAEEIFTAALLHDVGKIILGRFVQEGLAEIEKALAQGLSFETAETIVLGVNHAEVGAQVLLKWSLPGNVVNAVRWHHAPEKSERGDTMLDVVHAANGLCRMAGIGAGNKAPHSDLSAAVAQRLGLNPAHLEKLAAQAVKGSGELEQALAH
jgi:putative nucleotidyltransferase with HDIG domain